MLLHGPIGVKSAVGRQHLSIASDSELSPTLQLHGSHCLVLSLRAATAQLQLCVKAYPLKAKIFPLLLALDGVEC